MDETNYLVFHMEDEWELLNPSHTHPCCCYCPIIGGYLHEGDFCIVDLDGQIFPCRIYKITVSTDDSPDDLHIIIFIPESKLEKENISPLDPCAFNYVCGMQGVVQSNWTKHVKTICVLDVSYIFHIDTIQSGLYASCYGMSNAYYIRYRVFTDQDNMTDNKLSMLNNNQHVPFAHLLNNKWPQSYHHRIYQFLVQMKRNADGVLWTQRKYVQASGIGRLPPMHLSLDMWRYFENKLGRLSCFNSDDITSVIKIRSVPTYYYDLSHKVGSYPTTITKVVASSADQFKALRNMFGGTYGFGVRAPKGTKRGGVTDLMEFNFINAVDFFSQAADEYASSDVIDEEAPQIDNKIVFEYNELTFKVSIRYYYRYMRQDSERGRLLLGEINHHLASQSHSNMVVINTMFMYQSQLFRTMSLVRQDLSILCLNMFDYQLCCHT